jgi:hypothetical protein
MLPIFPGIFAPLFLHVNAAASKPCSTVGYCCLNTSSLHAGETAQGLQLMQWHRRDEVWLGYDDRLGEFKNFQPQVTNCPLQSAPYKRRLSLSSVTNSHFWLVPSGLGTARDEMNV